MNTTPKLPRYQSISDQAQATMMLGESGQYEFKRDVRSVTPTLLATLANWVAMDSSREVAHLLVGVQEVKDDTTGLVRAEPYGLERGLDAAVSLPGHVQSGSSP
jgi:hypothetical protein